MKNDRKRNIEHMKSRITRFVSETVGTPGSFIRRPSSVIFVVAILLFILVLPLFIVQKSSTREASFLRMKLKDLSVLDAEYKPLRDKIATFEQRKSSTKIAGVPQAMDDLSSSVDLKRKVKGVKSIGSREITGGTEESAEVQIEKVTMNELVNLLFRIEDAPMMLSIKRAVVKKTFEDPELFNVTLTLSLLIRK